jgi:hypothetical protein
MGFEITQNQIGGIKQIQFELTAADLLLNSFALPIQTTNAIFIGGYIITSGGGIPLDVGNFLVTGDVSAFEFMKVPTNIPSQTVLYRFNIGGSGVFLPQTAENYSLTWNYVSGNGQAKVIILYSEYI